MRSTRLRRGQLRLRRVGSADARVRARAGGAGLLIDRAQRGGQAWRGGRPPRVGRRRTPRRIEPRDPRGARAHRARRRDRLHDFDRRGVRRRARNSSRGRFTICRRRNGPFVAVNCAAIVETLLEAELFGIEDRTATGVRGRRGKFEHAHDGTLFLDEVADLSPAAQAKLLRAIQEMSVERVGGIGARAASTRGSSSATNRPLSDLVARGRFRLDLYYRLHGVEIAGAAAARPAGRHPGAGAILPRAPSRRSGRCGCPGGDRRAAGLRLARQRARTRAGDRASRGAGRVRTLELDDLPPAMLGGYTECSLPALARAATRCARGAAATRGWCSSAASNNKRRACRELGISYHTLQAYLRFKPERRRRVPPASRGRRRQGG